MGDGGGALRETPFLGTPMCPECRHIETNGFKCNSLVLRGMPYCYFHARLHRASKGPRPLKISAIETSKDVQTEFAKVLTNRHRNRLRRRRCARSSV